MRVKLVLTLFGQDSNADARVTQFDEGRVSSPPVILSDQQNIFSTHIAMDKILLFLWKQEEVQSFKNGFSLKTFKDISDCMKPGKIQIPTRKFMA